MKWIAALLLPALIVLVFYIPAFAQEENATIAIEGTNYLDLKIKSLDKYNDRLQKEQDRLLAKLKRKEKKFANRLKNTDSLAYARYRQQTLSYDSISKLSNADSTTVAAKTSHRKNSLTDSLKGVTSFLQSKAGATGVNDPQLQAYNGNIAQLQGQLNYRSYINDLITQRTNSLKNLSTSSNTGGFTGIEKQVFYGKAKMNEFKEMEEDPSKAEDKALEYLEGSKGFEGAMNGATTGGAGSMQVMAAGGASAIDLEKMGYQTKQQLQSSLQQRFGANLGGVAGQMSSQMSEWQDKANDITSGIGQAKQSLQQIKNINKPSFKINPMRGKPFWKRIEKQYSWQSQRESADGTQPAMINAAAMAGYKQDPKLTYGMGIATSVGLGQSWTNIRFSFVGVGLRSYLNWQWRFGIGLYGGYERMYKQAVFTNTTATSTTSALALDPSPHNTKDWTESILLGLTKSYRVSTKYNGQLQLLYDIWWQQKGLRSPLVLRFATITK